MYHFLMKHHIKIYHLKIVPHTNIRKEGYNITFVTGRTYSAQKSS